MTRRPRGRLKRCITLRPRSCRFPSSGRGSWYTGSPQLEEIRAYCQQQVDTLWDEVKRFDNPHTYYVDLSRKLWTIKNDMLRQKR